MYMLQVVWLKREVVRGSAGLCAQASIVLRGVIWYCDIRLSSSHGKRLNLSSVRIEGASPKKD